MWKAEDLLLLLLLITIFPITICDRMRTKHKRTDKVFHHISLDYDDYGSFFCMRLSNCKIVDESAGRRRMKTMKSVFLCQRQEGEARRRLLMMLSSSIM